MMRPNPLVFETHTRVFLNRLSAQYSRRVTLGDIPDDEWGRLASMGFDGVWLMGVWQRSEAARRVALVHENLRDEYGRALPGWGEGDVEASPYAVHGYTVDSTLGDAGSLAIVQEQLHRHGLSLIVDFVPNHLALDHPWTGTHPSRFVMPSPQQAHEHPDWYFTTEAGHVLAHGRDPYFGPWEDTAQVDFFSEDLRSAWTEQLLEMASIADGVRCDMAMLGMNRIFEWLWGEVSLHPRPADEFWEKAIGAVKAKYPDFVFIAEAYWDTETELRALGFDYTYDKHLYDRLRWEDGAAVGEYLSNQAEPDRWVRFVENHDEARAVEVFGRERSFAAATIATSLPGLRLFYDGQIEGRTTRMPVQVARWPDEIVDVGLHAAYQTL
ncbi:MAG: alpha-amylase family glycosyl hydrolase, partial [Dehalococcoidia bacterium]